MSEKKPPSPKAKRRAAPRGPKKPRRKPFVEDEKLQALVCDAFAEYGTILKAAEVVGISCEVIRTARRDNETFAANMDLAADRYAELIQSEVRRRGVEGWEEPVFQRGECTGYVRKYSDRLLEMEAKRTNSNFKERVAVEQKGTVEHQHTHTVQHNLENLSVDEQEQLLALLEKTESPSVSTDAASTDSSRVTH